MTTAIHKTEAGDIELTVTIPWPDVKKTYEDVVTKIVSESEVPGFRKGKAPRETVEKGLDKTKVYEEVIRTLLPKLYSEALLEHKLKPIINPNISLSKAKENESWEILIKTCERPTVELGEYKKKIQELKEGKAKKLWVPGQDQKPEKEEEKKPTLDEILDTLYSAITVTIPPILMEQEVHRLLSDLIDQTKKLGMTIDQYLSSTGKTSESIHKEYEEQAKRTIALEFALEEIADTEHISVSDKQIDEVIANAKTEEEKKSLQNQRYYLASILRRQETIKHIASL